MSKHRRHYKNKTFEFYKSWKKTSQLFEIDQPVLWKYTVQYLAHTEVINVLGVPLDVRHALVRTVAQTSRASNVYKTLSFYIYFLNTDSLHSYNTQTADESRTVTITGW